MTVHIPVDTRPCCELCGTIRARLTVTAEHVDGEGLTVPEIAVCISREACKRRVRRGVAGRKTI